MKLKNEEIVIDKINPFTNCKLEREPYALVLTEIVNSYADGFVLAINNEWGTGKSTFIKMWEQHLKNQKYKTLYFNAWENDFEDDVLVSLMSELEALKGTTTEKVFKNVVQNAAPLVKGLALGLLKTQIKKYVGDNFVNGPLNLTSEALAKGLEERIQSYASRKNSIDEFKKSLEKFVKLTDDNLPVIFIIDELDRCRPNYAVEVLEQIKHLFSVPGIIFVLSIDKVQLGHAVRGVYGSDNINADEYLRRFIDIEYAIPEPSTKLFCKHLYDYFKFSDFISSDERIKYSELKGDSNKLIEFSTALFNYERLPLRLQEKIFAHARLALRSFYSNDYLIPSLFIFLIYLKISHQSVYDNIKGGFYSLQELIDQIENIIPKGLENGDLRTFIYTEAILINSYNNSRDYNNKETIVAENKLIIKSKIDTSINNQTLLDMFQSLSQFSSNSSELSIKHLTEKIDLIETIK
ncbi:hypothetical protein EO244_06920 [Ancylomarina salipaludis]|uniref:KAP NTPase domain-containing protein n=1 Tax=Ancylomarina salipaludis TaxID=2501299 RepID=A0A4Q1JNE8_9BACT|nr:P-loop NTPase fold protein [Ancylomarina salipaludis]RXQ95590.1 hypothetical protein EO244_06920 [Ancylomarina salipaludis]